MKEVLKNSIYRVWIGLLLLTGAVYFFLRYIIPVGGPILLAFMVVTISGPFLKRLQTRLHLHRQFGILAMLGLFVLLLGLLCWLLVQWLFSRVPLLFKEAEAYVQQLIRLLQGSPVGELLLQPRVLEQLKEPVYELLHQGMYTVRDAGSLGIFLFTFLLAAFFLAKDYDHFMNSFLEKPEYSIFLEILISINRYIITFLKTQGAIMISIAITCSVMLWLFGIEGALVLGILTGVLDSLPFIGTGMVLVPVSLWLLLEQSFGRAFLVLGLYCFCIFLREWLEPRLIGRQTGLPPIAVLTSVYVGIALFGFSGIIKGPLGMIILLEVKKRYMQ